MITNLFLPSFDLLRVILRSDHNVLHIRENSHHLRSGDGISTILGASQSRRQVADFAAHVVPSLLLKSHRYLGALTSVLFFPVSDPHAILALTINSNKSIIELNDRAGFLISSATVFEVNSVVTHDENDVRFRGRFATCVATHDDPRDGVSEIGAVGGQTISGIDLGRQPERTVVLDLERRHGKQSCVGIQAHLDRTRGVHVGYHPTFQTRYLLCKEDNIDLRESKNTVSSHRFYRILHRANNSWNLLQTEIPLIEIVA